MTQYHEQAERAVIIELIEEAFAERSPPVEMSDSMQLSDTEYEEVMSFAGLHWRDVDVALLEKACDAVFWFSPTAFCFYLPGALASSLRENRYDLNYLDSLLGCLDRSPEPEHWDDFFAPRFTLLKPREIDAVAAWVRWLEQVQPDDFLAGSYARARETLALLKQRALHK